jgi:polyhydroxybutyrate depolymerase
MSNGANFTYVLWSARPGIFAAYAPCAGILRYPENLTLKPGPVLHFAGESDRTAPFEMQQESMAKVREVNGCKATSVEWGALCKLYPARSRSGAPFVSFIHKGGHSIPPQAVELMIKFFKENPRRKSSTGAL